MLSLGKSKLMIDQIDKGRTWKTGKLDYPLGRGINFQIEVKKIDPLLKSLKITMVWEVLLSMWMTQMVK